MDVFQFAGSIFGRRKINNKRKINARWQNSERKIGLNVGVVLQFSNARTDAEPCCLESCLERLPIKIYQIIVNNILF